MFRWWRNLPVRLDRSSREGDHGWQWDQFVEEADRDPNQRSYVALTARDGRLEAEGAILYRLDAASLLEPGRRAVYLRCVASAPRNRYRLVEKAAARRGVGEALVAMAMLDSLYAGFGGRVLGDPIFDAIPFYEKMEFRQAVDPQEPHVYYEIPEDRARAHLVKRGWI
jgi:GNAT superfamily N-acetyltransferase